MVILARTQTPEKGLKVFLLIFGKLPKKTAKQGLEEARPRIMEFMGVGEGQELEITPRVLKKKEATTVWNSVDFDNGGGQIGGKGQFQMYDVTNNLPALD